MPQDPDKIRRAVTFLPEIIEALDAIAEQDNRSFKGLMEFIIIEYLERRTGKKFSNKKQKE